MPLFPLHSARAPNGLESLLRGALAGCGGKPRRLRCSLGCLHCLQQRCAARASGCRSRLEPRITRNLAALTATRKGRALSRATSQDFSLRFSRKGKAGCRSRLEPRITRNLAALTATRKGRALSRATSQDFSLRFSRKGKAGSCLGDTAARLATAFEPFGALVLRARSPFGVSTRALASGGVRRLQQPGAGPGPGSLTDVRDGAENRSRFVGRGKGPCPVPVSRSPCPKPGPANEPEPGPEPGTSFRQLVLARISPVPVRLSRSFASRWLLDAGGALREQRP
jgi:hypothetical protein